MFEEIKTKVLNKFAEISTGTLFRVNVDNAKVWETYLSAFTEENRQGNNCSCCRHFLYQFSGIVGIKDNKMVTLWDFEVEDEEYRASVKAVGDYIRSLPIDGIFFNEFKKCGTDKNADPARGVVWNHFFLELPTRFVKKDFGSLVGAALDNKNVLKRSLEEITDDAVDTVIELIQQGSLYRGNEFLKMVQEFKKVKEKFKKTKKAERENFCWVQSNILTQALCRIRNSSIGTLLNDLSEGRELDSAVGAFEKVVAPSNYKRSTALITPRMVEDAKKRLEEMGLTGSLYRRMLSSRDLTAANALFIQRNTPKSMDVFEEMKEQCVNPKSFSKVEEVSIGDFISKILPTSKSVKVLLENRHLPNLVSLVGPRDEDDNKLFKWGNNFSWSYCGEAADSIKERVKKAGGKVDGVLRISLSWNNTDDLDLHLVEPKGFRVYYPNKRRVSPSGAVLDVDANGGDGNMEDPVENIYWQNLPKLEGEYSVIVNQFRRRMNENQGFEVELDFNGDTYLFSCSGNGMSGHNHHVLSFNYSKSGGVSITKGKVSEGSYSSKEKWGLKTGQFHPVKAITLSPNHWDGAIGNKHFFFLLDKCVADDKIRPFYNEFLREDLMKDRKVFEVLGGKVTLDSSEDELSGIGFSETVRNELFVEVTGKFKRTIKVKF